MIDFSALNTAVGSTFADDATIAVGDAEPVETRGIFDSRHFEVQSPDGEIGVSELVTTLAINLAETGPVPKGATVEVRGTTYRVKDMRHDGQGMTVLELELAE